MLHKEPQIISPATFSLIQKLQSLPELSQFQLVGGTALALQLGHRDSIDIDLFSQSDFDYIQLTEFLKSAFSFDENFVRKNTIIGFINNIKVDFITHPYQYVNPPLTEEGITFLSKEDIAAMKLNAIINSGQRLKDFIDVYFLLEHFSVRAMLGFFEKKYPNTNPLIALKAINYFDDIDEAISPPNLRKPLPLKKIKYRINNAVIHANKIFKDDE
ncbi:MAG: nucleotidyl transferase AbiEii/AbiGii toxin family protein [Bacteroidota bacterium]|nr:nucleotidyl transferase AbiEii/AbiGii toxin family protein [Bacteroidota bacterium]